MEQVEVPGAYTMRDDLISQLGNYFDGDYHPWSRDIHKECFKEVENQSCYNIATILDPRFKHKVFRSPGAQRLAQVNLQGLIKVELETEEPVAKRTKPNSDNEKANSFFGSLAELSQERGNVNSSFDDDDELEDKAAKLLKSYTKEALFDPNADPLLYWKKNCQDRPILAKLARKFLGSPLSTIASEREFKQASDITEERVQLLPENANKLAFLKYNLRAIGYRSLQLPVAKDSEEFDSGVEEAENEATNVA